jgi:hypothetical protein
MMSVVKTRNDRRSRTWALGVLDERDWTCTGDFPDNETMFSTFRQAWVVCGAT